MKKHWAIICWTKKKNLSRQVEKKIKKYLTELEKKENLCRLAKEKIEQYHKKESLKLKKYYDYDDPNYRGMIDRRFIQKTWWKKLLQTNRN